MIKENKNMLEFVERVGAEPKVIPTLAKEEPKKSSKSKQKDAETKEEKKNDQGKSSETPEHKDDSKNEKDLHN